MLKKFLIFLALLGLFLFYFQDMVRWGANKGFNDVPPKPALALKCTRTLMILQNYEETIAFYERAIKEWESGKWPENPDAMAKTYSRLGACYASLGKKGDSKSLEYYLKARGYYKTFIEKYPDHYWFEQVKRSNEELNAVIP